MENSALFTLSRSRFNHIEFTPVQAQVDGLLQQAASQLGDGSVLPALIGGGLIHQGIRLGAMATATRFLGEGRILLPLLVRGGSFAAAVAGEGLGYELIHRGITSIDHPDAALWRISGERGISQAWRHNVVNFGVMRGLAPWGAGQNPVVQHLITDAAMVGGHHLAYRFGVGARPEGDLATQFAEAEVANLQMLASLGAFHQLTGASILSVERSLDLTLRSRTPSLFASQGPRVEVREPHLEANPNLEMARNSLTSGRLFSLNPAIFLLPKALLGFPIGYVLSTMRRGWAVGSLTGLATLLAGRNLMTGADTVQWLGDIALLGTAATYGYLRARSLRREMATNPFRTEHDPAYPRKIPVPPGLVSNQPVDLQRPGTRVEVFDSTREADGFPRSFSWSVDPQGGFSRGQAIFYRVFDPHRFTFSMGRFARSRASRAIIPYFARWKGVDLDRFTSHAGQDGYRNFDDFFTRRLKEVPHFYPGAVPAEGRVVYMGRGDFDQALTIKGERISLRELLGEEAAARFQGPVGVIVTYLSPKDYHLSHSPVDGRVVSHRRIPGAAWTVGPEIWNESNIEGRPGTHYLNFNTRDVVLKETPYGPFATVYVAATNVYSTEIHAPVGGEVRAGMHEQSYHFGSTNVYVFGADRFYFPHALHPDLQLRFGRMAFLIPQSEVKPRGSD